MLGKLEESLAGLFKSAPKIPENGRKTITKWLPWIALVFGILQLLATWSLWRAGHRVSEVLDYLNTFGVDTGSDLSVVYWVALAFLAVSALFLLLAYPGLKAMKKAGWNWMFYGALLNLVYGVASLFFDNYYGGGFGRLLGAAIGTAISLWILFQIRDNYSKA